jgi:nucleoside-triphosphatase THEP1
MRKNILITGLPHCGKSTLLQNLTLDTTGKVGFFTRELIWLRERIGFEIETHSGKKSVFASVDFINTPHRISRYGVRIESLEAVLPEIENFNGGDLLYLDEIGEMQLLSGKFRKLVRQYLDAPNICLATMSQVFSCDFIRELKARKDTIIISITDQNRGEKAEFIRALIGKIRKAQEYAKDSMRFSIKLNKAIVRSTHGVRQLDERGGLWHCDCDFFQKYLICSHVLALEKYLE